MIWALLSTLNKWLLPSIHKACCRVHGDAIFVDFEERNTASVDVWVIFRSFSKKGRP